MRLKRSFHLICIFITVLMLCSCESFQWTWGGPSAKQIIDSSFTAEELLDNASIIAMYSQAYDITTEYSPQGQYYYERLKELILNEVNTTSEKARDVVAIIKKYETISFPDGYDSYAFLKKELIKKVVADDDWIKDCGELLRKTIERCESLSDLALLSTYSRKYLSADSSFDTKVDALILDSIKKTNSILALVELNKDTNKKFEKDISETPEFVEQYEALANERITSSHSLSDLFALRSSILSTSGKDVAELPLFKDKYEQLASESISTCKSISDLFALRTVILENYKRDIGEKPLFQESTKSLIQNEMLACSSLKELVSFRDTIKETTGISIDEEENYRIRHAELIDDYLKSVSSLSSIEEFLSEGLDSSEKYLDTLRRIVRTEIEGGSIDGVSIDYSVINSIDDAKTILYDFNALTNYIKAINSSDTSKRVYDLGADYEANKKTSLFDSVISHARVKRLDFLSNRDKEVRAYNEVKEQLDYYDAHYATSMQESIFSLTKTYLNTYPQNSPYYSSEHYSTIENRYEELQAVISWKKTEKYYNLLQNVPQKLLNLPIYLGHRGNAYENTGMTIQEFLYSQDFSSWMILITESGKSSSQKIIIDMKYSETIMWFYQFNVEYSFTFEAQKDKLVLTDVSYYNDYIYNNQDYTYIKKYFDWIVSGNGLTAEAWKFLTQ